MPYTTSKAQKGLGSSLSINTGTISTPVWTVIGEITDLTQSGKSAKNVDTTNLQSAAEEFLPTILAASTIKIPMNRVSGDAGQAAVLSAFNALELVQFKVILPLTTAQTETGDSWVFLALVEEFNDIGNVKPDGKIATDASLKVSGGYTFTAGS
jgi:hypothetical protein